MALSDNLAKKQLNSNERQHMTPPIVTTAGDTDEPI